MIKEKTKLFRKKVLINSAKILIGFAILSVGCESKSHYDGPLSPEESVKTFEFAEDLKAEIFATEPNVIDPVAMEFDEQGNAYVVGMLDAYKPDSVKGKGRIVMLKDLNGDGRADTSIVFADSLREATSILPWQGGLIVTAAPNILYFKDTDGDGRADSKEVLFTGFFNKNEEAQISNLRFGIDNWIYANNNGQAGEITFNRVPGARKLLMQGADFRFRLDRNQFELTTGTGQYGLALDDWGHRFFTQNSLHIQQAVIPRRYLERNPFLPASAKKAIVNISDHDPLMFQKTPAPYWRAERTNRRNKQFKENHLDRVEYEKDHFTAATGATLYDGDALPKEYYSNVFTGDGSGSLVHRDILSNSDTAPFFVARRPEQEKNKEFLASTDTWVRPVNFTVGPNGDFYMIDMYRQHIETPMSIPEDLQVGMDFNAGNRYGRIYRIVPKNAPAYKKVSVDLRSTKSSDLVASLSHQNRWWRLQAQRLLLERQDKTVIPAVRDLFNKSEDPRFRLHAIYVLEGMNALDAEIVKKAMKDPSAGVRENAAMLSERYPQCLPQLKEMTTDSSIRVAFQATLSLGEFNEQSVTAVLANVLEKHGQSAWFRTAVLSSSAGASVDLLKNLSQKSSFFNSTAPWKFQFLNDFATVVGARNQKAQIIALLETISQSAKAKSWQPTVVKGLTTGLEVSKGSDASVKESLKNIEAEVDVNTAKAVQDLKAVLL
ncbi:PVC-type heme-binding CxxCH protein [Segetibacter koreensis]|uniref:PVC-type heme-binding CxxCH protein n=1 Tax=Segetibacter koreensis TaxID=398037 RepID=UPI000371C0D5|nr:PVC-type heme-binding CxxCH protein [Segetibacter koreensis]